jgi:hypothetical protein
MQNVRQSQADATVLSMRFIERLWPRVIRNGGPRPLSTSHVHLRQVFDAAWLDALALPIEDDKASTQTVSLVEDIHFTRGKSGHELEEAYRSHPRTRVYEGFNSRSDGWFSIAAMQFAALARCRVGCSVYASYAGDKTMGYHIDEWYGVALQMRGAKTWQLKQRLKDKPQTITVEAGDVLLLPRGVFHDVSTPKESVHLLFAFITQDSLVP